MDAEDAEFYKGLHPDIVAAVTDDNSSPEAQAAMAAARAVVPVFSVPVEECDHDHYTKIGEHFENDVKTFTVTRCTACGDETVIEEQA